MPHVEHELLTLLEQLSSSSPYRGVGVARFVVLCVIFCRSLFVHFILYFLSFLPFTTNDYPFCIFKVFFNKSRTICSLLYSGNFHKFLLFRISHRHDLNTDLNNLSTKVLSLYCDSDEINSGLCLTCVFSKFVVLKLHSILILSLLKLSK